jgi:multiple sugar transport system substrate-binding protein
MRTPSKIAVLTAGLLLLAACGRAADTASPADARPVGDGPATGNLTVWAQGAEAERLPALLKDFETANPGVHVTVTAIPWSAAHDKYQTAIAAGTTPDIGQLGTTWMGEFGTANTLAPTPSDLGTGTFYPGAVASTKVGGGSFGIPWYVDTPVLYYRTDLAARAGHPSAPQSWDELKSLAKDLQTKAGARYGISLGTKDFQGFLPFAWSNGAALTNGDGTQWTIDSPAMVEAAGFYQSFFAEGIANRGENPDPGAHEAAFVDGSVPMFFGGPAEVGQLDKAGGAGFSEKYATAVRPKAKTSTSFVGGSNLVVFKKPANAGNTDAAWKLIRFLSRPATQIAWYRATGDLPSVQAAWDDPAMSGDKKLAVFGQQLKTVTAPPGTTAWTEVQKAGDTQLEQLTVAGKDPGAAMKTLQSTASTIGTGAK